jgi:hypothetical protein
MIGTGIPLCISLVRDEFPLGLLVVECASMIVFAIFTRLVRRPYAAPNGPDAVLMAKGYDHVREADARP